MKKSEGNQRTLFQSWGKKSSSNFTRPNSPGCSSAYNLEEVIDLNEDDDDGLLAAALEMDSIDPGPSTSTRFPNNVPSNSSTSTNTTSNSIPVEIIPGFDMESGDIWIYPTNYPVRDYQFNIVQKALYQNIMVTLPTGLGKTFIAAVVMYNYYRWYPQGKVVFMAPTKPLVAQQIEACYQIMGIPQADTAEMTGNMAPTKRENLWRTKRVFFLTPQVLQNDLSRGSCAAADVVLLVVDEAHKALGNHSYCQVVREILSYTTNFRVLALSATPGDDIKAVQQVLTNLLISHVELRSEDSQDIKPYTHARTVEKIVVPLGDQIVRVKTQYLKVLDTIVGRLFCNRVVWQKDPLRMSKFMLLSCREQFRKGPAENMNRAQVGSIEGDFAMGISLYHAYELLHQHGILSFYNFIKGIMEGSKGMTRAKTELMRHQEFMGIMEDLRESIETPLDEIADTSALFSQFSSPSRRRSMQFQASDPRFKSHPKLQKLEEIVVEHFKKFAESTSKGSDNLGEVKGKPSVDTRVMIFSQYRDSVKEITTILCRHKPLVRVMSFIGQASTGKSSKGLSQKEQLEVVHRFRMGGYNTLVSTCVGEEGLDIGDVDLIVCFDAHASPIRLVQRMGRTGRKRDGRIVVLVAEGKEEQVYKRSQSNKKSIHKAIVKGTGSFDLYQDNPRMIPKHLTPTVFKMEMTVGSYVAKGKNKRKSDANKSSGKIKALLTKAVTPPSVTSRKDDGLLSYGELMYWQENFKLKGCEAGTTPKAAVRRRSSDSPSVARRRSCDPVEPAVKPLSLTEWMAWQSAPSPVLLVSHSRRTKHLVEILEFIELHGSDVIGEDDSYDAEMRSFLDPNDLPGNDSREDIVSGQDGDGAEARNAKSDKRISTKQRRIVIKDDDAEELDVVRQERGTESAEKLKESKPKEKAKKKRSIDKKRVSPVERKARWKEYLEKFERDDDFEASLDHENHIAVDVQDSLDFGGPADEHGVKNHAEIIYETNVPAARTARWLSCDKEGTLKDVKSTVSSCQDSDDDLGPLSQLLPSSTPQVKPAVNQRLQRHATDVPTPPSLDDLDFSFSPIKSSGLSDRKRKDVTPQRRASKVPKLLPINDSSKSARGNKSRLIDGNDSDFCSREISFPESPPMIPESMDFEVEPESTLGRGNSKIDAISQMAANQKIKTTKLSDVGNDIEQEKQPRNTPKLNNSDDLLGDVNMSSSSLPSDAEFNEFHPWIVDNVRKLPPPGSPPLLPDDKELKDIHGPNPGTVGPSSKQLPPESSTLLDEPCFDLGIMTSPQGNVDNDDLSMVFGDDSILMEAFDIDIDDRKASPDHRNDQIDTKRCYAINDLKKGSKNKSTNTTAQTGSNVVLNTNIIRNEKACTKGIKTKDKSIKSSIEHSISLLSAFERTNKSDEVSTSKDRVADTHVSAPENSTSRNKTVHQDKSLRDLERVSDTLVSVPENSKSCNTIMHQDKSLRDSVDVEHMYPESRESGNVKQKKPFKLKLKRSPGKVKQPVTGQEQVPLESANDSTVNSVVDAQAQSKSSSLPAHKQRLNVPASVDNNLGRHPSPKSADLFPESPCRERLSKKDNISDEDSPIIRKPTKSAQSIIFPESPCQREGLLEKDITSDVDSPIIRKRGKGALKKLLLESPALCQSPNHTDADSPIVGRRLKAKISNGNVVAIAESEDDEDAPAANNKVIAGKDLSKKSNNAVNTAYDDDEDDDDDKVMVQRRLKPVGKASIYRRTILSSPAATSPTHDNERKKKKFAQVIDSGSEDEFECDYTKACNPKKQEKVEEADRRMKKKESFQIKQRHKPARAQHGQPKRSKKMHTYRLNHFIDEEAELSGSDIDQYSSDEDVDGYSEFDSFIDDSTQRTQVTPCPQRRHQSPGVDMHAVYRQSLFSPVGRLLNFKTPMYHRQKNRYKMKYNVGRKRTDSSSEAEETWERESEQDGEGSDVSGPGTSSENEQEPGTSSENEQEPGARSDDEEEPGTSSENEQGFREASQIRRARKRVKRKRIKVLDESTEETPPKISKVCGTPVIEPQGTHRQRSSTTVTSPGTRLLEPPEINRAASVPGTSSNDVRSKTANMTPSSSPLGYRDGVFRADNDKSSFSKVNSRRGPLTVTSPIRHQNEGYGNVTTAECSDNDKPSFVKPRTKSWTFKSSQAKDNPRVPGHLDQTKGNCGGVGGDVLGEGEWEDDLDDLDLLDALEADDSKTSSGAAPLMASSSERRESKEIALAMTATDDDFTMEMSDMPTFSLDFDFDQQQEVNAVDKGVNQSACQSLSNGLSTFAKPYGYGSSSNTTIATKKPLLSNRTFKPPKASKDIQNESFTKIRPQTGNNTNNNENIPLKTARNFTSDSDAVRPHDFSDTGVTPTSRELRAQSNSLLKNPFKYSPLSNTCIESESERSLGTSVTAPSRASAHPAVVPNKSIIARSPSGLSFSEKNKDKLVILVDTKEISNSQVVSQLRLKQNMRVEVCQLTNCDYVVSNRMAVERRLVSDVANGANSAKLVSRMRLLCTLYDRPCIIIEKDRVRPGEQERNNRSTAYFSTLSSIALTHIKILYSDSQEHTAFLLSELALVEAKKKAAIVAPLSNMSNETEKMFRFLLTIPMVNYATALCLSLKYRNLRHLIHSSTAELQSTTSHLIATRAQEIYAYLRHSFNTGMLGSK
ncbi:uncharacterized protein LOC5503392 isoform X2 [Nematostella vectensis]|uniref:uncharacterized protein LOC5503392 isoform X2 n=1 Tax=Nematostella vectensis TaxID=45351 RepID=UPI00207707D2|nr:uncharacterized protein LOC5503392 isoform X2 [Nematostella vectensis]